MMMERIRYTLVAVVVMLAVSSASTTIDSHPQGTLNEAFVNGKWFNGTTFDERTFYSVRGDLTTKKPSHLDRTIDLAGLWVIPPFGEAHNHNLGTGIVEEEKKTIQRYLADGVFYVMIQANLPLTDGERTQLGIEKPESVDAIFANGGLTGSGGHPIRLFQTLLGYGAMPGETKDSIKDRLYFTIDSKAELDNKWPLILSRHPDFIKVFLLFSDEYEKRKDDPAYFGLKGLNPELLPTVVAKAHARKLRVSVHVANAADFHNAVMAGADVVAHIPPVGRPIDKSDARMAAKRGIVVVTTCLDAVPSLIRAGAVREADIRKTLAANLKLLMAEGVDVAIGSDDPTDTSVKEFHYLSSLGILDNLTLLKLWTENTPQAIFPGRRIGKLREGYEASFLALEGDPTKDLGNLKRIKMRFKSGVELGKEP